MKKAAATAACIALAASLAGCAAQQDQRGMTDDEIREAIKQGDEQTAAQIRSEMDSAIDKALAGYKMSDADKQALRESILSEVDGKIAAANNGGGVVNRYVTEQHVTQKPADEYVTNVSNVTNEYPTYITEQSAKLPRIDDGTPIQVSLASPAKATDKDGCTYEITSLTATAYNFAADTPYAGGGYAYRITVKAMVTYIPYYMQPGYVRDPNEGVSVHPIPSRALELTLSPYDVAINNGISGSMYLDEKTIEFTETINTNMLPEKITAASLLFDGQ